MKNHELLTIIGEVSEDYVLAADSNAERLRFRWKTLAACAACAALILAAYPAYQAFCPQGAASDSCLASSPDAPAAPQDSDGTPVQQPGLHSYTLVEESVQAMITMKEGWVGPAPERGGAGATGGTDAIDEPAADAGAQGQDAPIQETAAAQYDSIMKNGGINPAGPNPDWYGGAWIDNSDYPEAKLVVAIVDGFRTTELEAQIEEWCGGEVGFQDAKYALAHLYALQDTVVDAITGGSDALSCGIGVDVTANCLGVDIYSDGSPVSDAVLAKLAQLDPDGDAIRVRVFTGKLDTLTDEVGKGPAPGGVTQPAPSTVEDAERETSQIAPDPNTIPELPQEKQNAIAEGE